MNIFISIPAQTLELFGDDGLLLRRYAISTAKKGAGEAFGSFMTPRGKHIIRAKIGGGCAENTVFVRRRPTGEIWSPELAEQFPTRDWILTRILWLSGCQPGFNRLGKVDTMRRYVYLHGSPDTAPMGEPGSIGCVRMRNRDIAELFDQVPAHIPVNIGEYRVISGDLAYSSARRQQLDAVVPPERCDDCIDVVACDGGGEAIGVVRLHRSGQRGFIDTLYVQESWRHKEVASNLVRRLLDVARTTGITKLEVAASPALIRFFARLGFAKLAKRVSGTKGGAVRMQRRLVANSRST